MKADELITKGQQLVKFKINGLVHSHKFCVSSLSTNADAILGTDFLAAVELKLDLEGRKLWLFQKSVVGRNVRERRTDEMRDAADGAVLTVFLTPTDGRNLSSCWMGFKEREETSPDR